MTIGVGKWGAALFVSTAIHAGAAGWLYQTDDETNIAGGSPTEISLLGDAFQNETVAGDPSEMIEPTEPEIVDTSETKTTELPEEAVTETSDKLTEVEVVEPPITPIPVTPKTIETTRPDVVKVVETNTQTEQTAKAEPVQQTPSEPIAFAEAEPTELLVAEIQLADINIASLLPAVLSEKTISPPLLEMEPVTVEQEEPATPDEVKPQNVETETLSPTIEKIEPQEPELTVKPEEEKVLEKKKISKKSGKKNASKKPVKKKKKAKKKNSAGSEGKGKRKIRAGDSEGSKTAKRNSVGKSKGRKSSKNGNASVSNYKGKVRRKVKRSFRRPRGGGRSRKDAVVRFVLSVSGAVRSVRLVRSSGSKKLDQAALTAVRRASPFPKPPGGVRGASLNFTLPFGT